MRIISLGWGIQSFTLAAMVALGELEPIDAAIHADTTHEASWTYDFSKRWTPWLIERGVNVVTVIDPVTKKGIIENGEIKFIPAYTLSHLGEKGKLNRACTERWKIRPINRWIKQNRKPDEYVEDWIGISLDEFQRMKDNKISWIKNRWPLIEKHMTRSDCEQWLLDHGLELPQKSSCYFCPFHEMKAWQTIKNAGNGDWNKAIEADKSIRNGRKNYRVYLHSSCYPLEDIDLRTPQEKGQLELWANWDDECSGICGI